MALQLLLLSVQDASNTGLFSLMVYPLRRIEDCIVSRLHGTTHMLHARDGTRHVTTLEWLWRSVDMHSRYGVRAAYNASLMSLHATPSISSDA
jgi:hypothetical protein